MSTLWHRWVAHCQRPMDTRIYALVRIGIALCVLGDLLQIASRGMVVDVFTLYADGGLSGFTGEDYVLGELLGANGGLVAYAVCLGSMACVLLGIGTRPALVIGALAYAQLGAMFPPGDRAIDRVLRTTMLVLVFSGAHTRWSLWLWLRNKAPRLTAPAWPADMVRWLLVMVYLSAGAIKAGAGRWHMPIDPPVLLRIMCDPTSANLDHLFWVDHAWIFDLGGYFTLALELSGFLILTRFMPWWAIGGAFMHLGIATTMGLGMFSWGMLALYPILFAPWIIRGLDRLQQRRTGNAPQPG